MTEVLRFVESGMMGSGHGHGHCSGNGYSSAYCTDYTNVLEGGWGYSRNGNQQGAGTGYGEGYNRSSLYGTGIGQLPIPGPPLPRKAS